MEVCDIEHERQLIRETTEIDFASTGAAIRSKEIEESNVHNYLNLVISSKTNVVDLSTFLEGILLRRKTTVLEAASLHFKDGVYDRETNQMLLKCLGKALSSTSRLYLEYMFNLPKYDYFC